MDTGVEMPRQLVATYPVARLSREDSVPSTVPTVQYSTVEADVDPNQVVRSRPPDETVELPEEPNFDAWKPGQLAFDPYTWTWQPVPIPWRQKILQKWFLPDGRMVGTWHWKNTW